MNTSAIAHEIIRLSKRVGDSNIEDWEAQELCFKIVKLSPRLAHDCLTMIETNEKLLEKVGRLERLSGTALLVRASNLEPREGDEGDEQPTLKLGFEG